MFARTLKTTGRLGLAAVTLSLLVAAGSAEARHGYSCKVAPDPAKCRMQHTLDGDFAPPDRR